MIPKIIHYCWFGCNPLPESAMKCINSWRKFLPDYEIKEWNESNYDVHKTLYIHEAYEAKKYAFVSDYARFDILYQYGGIYFDTDVEVLKSMDDIIERGPFMGREAGAHLKDFTSYQGEALAVAPGLALGADPGMQIYEELLSEYNDLSFRNADGSLNMRTVCEITADVLIRHGIGSNNEEVEELDGLLIYPADYFCPMDHTNGNKVTITDRTVSIHLYDCSWMDHDTMSYKLHLLKNWMIRHFGKSIISNIADIIKGRKK